MKQLLRSGVVVRQRSTILLLVAVLAASGLIGGNPLWTDVSVYTATFALLALSVGIPDGQAGILSVGQAAFGSIGAFGTAILTVRYGWSPYLSLPVSVLVPVLIAYPLARVITRLSHLALAIATLVFGEIVLILLREGGQLTGGFIGISGVPRLGIASTSFRYHVFVWAVVIVVVALYSNLVSTANGRALRTIRHDPLRAAADGIPVAHKQAATFALAAGLAGLAGWLYAHYITFIAFDSMPPSFSITLILMAVVGGTGTVAGPVLGAVVLQVVDRYLPQADSLGMVYGGVLIVSLVFAPDGLLGIGSGFLDRVRRRTPEPQPTAAGGAVNP